MERSFDGSIRIDTSASGDSPARLENTIKSLEEAFGIGNRSIGAASDMAVTLTVLPSGAADGSVLPDDVIGLTGGGNSGGEARVYAPYIFGAEIPRRTGSAYPTPSSYAQSPLSAAGIRSAPQTFKIRLAVGGADRGARTFKADGSSTVSIDWNDNTMSNGW